MLDGLWYGGIKHSGAGSIYRSAKREPSVSLATFRTRFRRLADARTLSEASIEEALWLSVGEFKQKYATRKTMIDIAGEKYDLQAFFETQPALERVDYRNFWQRVRALKKKGLVDRANLMHALTMDAPSWHTFYGGGRHKIFVYDGEEYPEQTGTRFHGVAAFLLTIGRYADRALIWSRLKSGWNLDDALAIPVAFISQRTGTIYRITRRKTGSVYVGLTLTTVEQRWAIHLRRASEGVTTKLGNAIREDGSEGFDVDVLESGIKDPSVLPAREVFWVERLGALGENGLNSAKPGGMGSPGGKSVQYEGETFRSIEEASVVLGKRLGMARHIVRTRLQKGMHLPKANEVRRHSRHPDAGSNLFRRWLGILKRHAGAVENEWVLNYDRFKADVSPVPSGLELVRKRTADPWGPNNFEWVETKTKVERIHGKSLSVHGVSYPSLQAIAETYGIVVSTLKNRMVKQGMSVEQAVSTPLGATSYKQPGQPVIVDGTTFRSKRQAILYIAASRSLTEDQAKYRSSLTHTECVVSHQDGLDIGPLQCLP